MRQKCNELEQATLALRTQQEHQQTELKSRMELDRERFIANEKLQHQREIS
jgi:hypothetical protein